jgi:archaellum biogenesis ATPase FlaH
MLTLAGIARALGGEISGGQVLAPGPGHGRADRSLSVKLSHSNGEGFFVHSFAHDDPIVCRDYVRGRLGLPSWKPKGHDSKQDTRTTVYEFRDPATGEVRYRKERIDRADGSKTFVIKPKGRGGPPLIYGAERLADLGADQPVIVVEGERKVDRLRELGAIAVSADAGASSRWRPEHAKLLRGLRIVMWPDSDSPGEAYIANAAAALRAEDPDADIRIVRPFGPPNGGKGRDVCDWEGDANALARLADSAETYEFPQPSAHEAAPSFRRIINPADWEGVPVPERKWIVPDYIPHAAVTMLSGDGGIGKSILALQLAAARALGRDWIGLLPEPGRTLVLSTEDDSNELHRRMDNVRRLYGTRFEDLAAHVRLVDLVGEDSILALFAKGRIAPTPMYHTLDAYMALWQPSLVVLDVLAELFAGDESARPQTRQFVNLLKQLARKHDCAVLLIAHPSLTGINTGTGLSGSTDWNNGMRARMYFSTQKGADGTETDESRRTLKGMKSNYSERGGKIDLQWKDGVFVRLNGPSGFDKIAAEQKADDVFLSLVAKFQREGRDVSPNPSRSYAPTLFRSEPEAAGLSQESLAVAMSRLLRYGKVQVELFGPPSHQRKRLVLAEDSANA